MGRSRYRDEDDEDDRRSRRSSRYRDDEEEDEDDDDERPPRRRPSRRSGFRCPYCDTNESPRKTTKISNSGWVMFVVLLFLFFPLCWIGLLMKEEARVCSDCGMKLT